MSKKFVELAFMLSESELAREYPKGTEIIKEDEDVVYVSTGKTSKAMASICMASYPSMELEVFTVEEFKNLEGQ